MVASTVLVGPLITDTVILMITALFPRRQPATHMSGWAGLKPMDSLPSSRLSRRLANTTG